MSLQDIEKNLVTRASELTKRIEGAFTDAHSAFDALEKRLESEFGPSLNTTLSLVDFGNIVSAVTSMSGVLVEIQTVIKEGQSLTQDLVDKINQAVTVYNNVKTLLGVK